MILLEQNGTVQTYYTAAQLNHYMAFGSSGRVWGMKLTSTSNQVLTSAGMLLIRGYRISFDAETLITFGAFPTSPEIKRLMIEVTVTNENTSAVIKTGSLTAVNEIEKGPGVYQYLLATFTLTPTGITEFVPVLRNIERGTGAITRISDDASALPESLINVALGPYDDGVYVVNTKQNGDEIVIKSGESVCRYTVSGMLKWNDGWVGA